MSKKIQDNLIANFIEVKQGEIAEKPETVIADQFFTTSIKDSCESDLNLDDYVKRINEEGVKHRKQLNTRYRGKVNNYKSVIKG